jgi:hypothetical protein
MLEDIPRQLGVGHLDRAHYAETASPFIYQAILAYSFFRCKAPYTDASELLSCYAELDANGVPVKSFRNNRFSIAKIGKIFS